MVWHHEKALEGRVPNSLTIPTKISLLRIPLAVIFFVLIWHGYLKWALTVFLLTALSDFVDGYIAKKYGMESVTGKIADSVVDRIFIISSFFAVFFGPLNDTMSLWVLIIVVVQDVLLGILAIITVISKGQSMVRVSIPGKIATLCQEIFIPVILLKNIFDYEFHLLPFEIAVVVTSLMSCFHHLYIWAVAWKR